VPGLLLPDAADARASDATVAAPLLRLLLSPDALA